MSKYYIQRDNVCFVDAAPFLQVDGGLSDIDHTDLRPSSTPGTDCLVVYVLFINVNLFVCLFYSYFQT